jgi:hypothetical protein
VPIHVSIGSEPRVSKVPPAPVPLPSPHVATSVPDWPETPVAPGFRNRYASHHSKFCQAAGLRLITE